MMNITAKRGFPPTGYYTAAVAKRKLGNVSDGMLRSYVQSGEVERTIPPGRKQGFYKREDVDKLARSFDNMYADRTERTGTEFRRATKEDMSECVQLLIAVFGGGNTTEKRQAWLDKNPDIAYIVRSKGKIVGCAFVLPLLPEKIDAIFNDQTSASMASITANDIQEFQPGKEVYLYVVSMGVQPGSQFAKRARGLTLVRGLIGQLQAWGSQGIDIKQITARSDTYDGIHLMKHMGFTEVESVTTNRNFVIDIERSGIADIVRYKKALAEYKATHQQKSARPSAPLARVRMNIAPPEQKQP